MTKTDEKLKKIKVYQEEIKLFLMGLGAVSSVLAFIFRFLGIRSHIPSPEVMVKSRMYGVEAAPRVHAHFQIDWWLTLFLVLVIIFIGWGIMHWLGTRRRSGEKN